MMTDMNLGTLDLLIGRAYERSDFSLLHIFSFQIISFLLSLFLLGFLFFCPKSRSIRDFDNYATCLVGKFEVFVIFLHQNSIFFSPSPAALMNTHLLFSQTVDTYYRRCSSSCYVGNVSVPLLCISALDDPVCTREAIPWDECRSLIYISNLLY